MRLLAELLLVAACVGAGVVLGLAQRTFLHMDSSGYMVFVFALGAAALGVAVWLGRRYG